MRERPVALVTGGAQGIGLAIVRRLADDGCRVAFTSEHQPPGTADGPEGALALHADFRRPVAAAEAVEEVVERCGRIDILVNNAGVTLNRCLDDTTESDVDLLMAVNLLAPWHATRAAVPHMRAAGGGSVINVSSLHGDLAMPAHSAYAATKGGLQALTRQLAVELAEHGIRVNAVQPGLVAVPRFERDRWAGAASTAQQIPLGRIGRPEDIADAVSYLAGDQASYVTGIVLRVDGGLGARLALR